MYVLSVYFLYILFNIFILLFLLLYFISNKLYIVNKSIINHFFIIDQYDYNILIIKNEKFRSFCY